MPIKYLLFISFFWIGLHTMFSLAQLDTDLGQFDPSTSDQANALNALPFVSLVKMQAIPFVGISLPIPSPTFFDDLKTLLLWDYPFWSGNFVFFRYFILTPLSFVTMILLIVQVGPVIISAANVLVSAFIGPVARTLGGALRGI